MKLHRQPRPLILAAVVSLALGLGGCGKPAPEDALAAEDSAATPPPAPSVAPDRSGRKALGAYNAVSRYLKDQDPELGNKLHRAAERFVRDKDKWRTRLQDRQRTLQPKIAQVREQLARAEGKSATALGTIRQQLASLESQHAEAAHRLSELDSITSETWKNFRERLKLDADDAPPSDADADAK